MTSYLADQSLYVMQNEFGLIKIGRSVDPEQRRSSLEKYEKCRIALILVRPGEGHREEEFHIRLADHRIANEWFDGRDEARLAIANHLAPDGRLIWRYPFDLKGSEVWLDGFWNRQIAGAVPKSIRKVHGHIRNAKEPGWWVETFAWQMYWMMETGIDVTTGVHRDENGAQYVTAVIDGKERRMPDISRDIAAAMSLWPPHVAPASWEGSALDCCKAALEARRACWKAKQAEKRRPR